MSGRNRRSRRAERALKKSSQTATSHIQKAFWPGLALAVGLMGPALTAEAADVNVTTNAPRVDLDSKSGATVDIASGVTIKNDQPSSTKGTVEATKQAWTLTNNGTIDGRQDDPFLTNDGVKFTKGGTINNQTGASITGFYGVFTGTTASNVNNAGSITGVIRGVELQAGGTVVNAAGATISSPSGGVNIINGSGSVTNSGTITSTNFNGVSLGAGGTVDNKATGTISGGTSAVLIQGAEGTVINAGLLKGGSGADGVALGKGGTVTNLAGATITGSSASSNTVSIINPTKGGGVVTNSGLITNTAGKSFATGVAIENGTLNNNAGGEINGFFNAVWMNGNSTGIINNSGKIIATGGDAIEMRGGTVLNDTSGVITGKANGIFNTTRDLVLTNKGVITGQGGTALLLNGTGKSDVINYGTLNGAVNLSTGDGSLTVFTGSSITGAVDGRAGIDTLRLSGAGTGTYDGSYKNFEVFDVDAAGGKWTFNGGQTFTSATVTNGTLIDNGTLTAPLTVKSGATLTGTGSAGPTTVAGIIAPGNGIGSFGVTGDLTIQAGSTYQVQVDNTGAGDKIAATGKASITGGTLAVQAAPGKYNTSSEYVIVTATGGVTGSGFTTLTTDMAFLTPTVRYDPNQVVLTLKISQIDFGTVAVTGNQQAVATGVQPLGPGNKIWDAILPLTAPQARTALNALAGEIYPGLTGSALEDSRYLREAVNERMRNAADTSHEGFGLWVQPFGSWGSLDATTQTLAVDHDITGLFFGADVARGGWRFGAAGGLSRSESHIDVVTNDAVVETGHLAAYLTGKVGGFGIRLAGGYSQHRLQVDRNVAFAGFSEGERADLDGTTSQLVAEVDYAFALGGVTVAPFANVIHVDSRLDDFTETGGAAALTGRGARAKVTFGSLGVRGDAGLWEGDGRSLHARGSVSWRRSLDDVSPNTRLSFGPSGTVFGVSASPISEDAVNAEAGLEWRSGGVAFSLFYSGQFSDSADDQGVRLGFTLAP